MQEANRQTLWAQWRRLMDGFGVAAAASEPLFVDLLARYGETHRAYHDQAHLADVLDTAEDLAAEADDPNVVALAAWFHDAVYNPRRGDNEDQSADLAVEQLGKLDLAPGLVAEVARLVRLTKHHRVAAGDRNGAVLLDADLAILGAERNRYAAYARAIRQEYAWVDEETYRRQRAKVLQRFLARQRIYSTERSWRAREEQARANLAWEIEQLVKRM